MYANTSEFTRKVRKNGDFYEKIYEKVKYISSKKIVTNFQRILQSQLIRLKQQMILEEFKISLYKTQTKGKLE